MSSMASPFLSKKWGKHVSIYMKIQNVKKRHPNKNEHIHKIFRSGTQKKVLTKHHIAK